MRGIRPWLILTAVTKNLAPSSSPRTANGPKAIQPAPADA